MADWQQDPEAWKAGNEELLNEYEKKLQAKMDAETIKRLDEQDEKIKKELDAKFGDLSKGRRHQHWILDENNQVVKATFGEWAVWFKRNQSRHVGFDEFDYSREEERVELLPGKWLPKWKHSGYVVSTVFLGLDHNYSDEGPPILFETMIFCGDKTLHEYQERYATWKEAEVGHQLAVGLVKDRIKKLKEGKGK